jgi:hypothetical protein
VLSGEGTDPNDRPAGRTYINPALRPFKRPNAGSLQDRRTTSSNDLVGGGGRDIGTPTLPCPHLIAFLYARPAAQASLRSGAAAFAGCFATPATAVDIGFPPVSNSVEQRRFHRTGLPGDLIPVLLETHRKSKTATRLFNRLT